MERQTDDQPDRDQGLYHQLGFVLRCAFGILMAVVLLHDLAYRVGQFGAIAEPLHLLHQYAGQQATIKTGTETGAMRMANSPKFQPACSPMIQVLRLTDQGADATQCGTNGSMHHQTAQKGTKLFEGLILILFHLLVMSVVMFMTKTLAG